MPLRNLNSITGDYTIHKITSIYILTNPRLKIHFIKFTLKILIIQILLRGIIPRNILRNQKNITIVGMYHIVFRNFLTLFTIAYSMSSPLPRYMLHTPVAELNVNTQQPGTVEHHLIYRTKLSWIKLLQHCHTIRWYWNEVVVLEYIQVIYRWLRQEWER